MERAAWLDPEGLKERFLTLSAELHPDKAADKPKAEGEFRALNEAHQILRNTRTRLLHLLELSGARKQEHVQTVPGAALDLFPKIAELTRSSDALLKEKVGANSPMLRVQFLDKALTCVDSIQAVQSELQQRVGKIESNLRATSGASLRELEEAAAALGFLERWSAQLQERAAALTFFT